MRCQAKVHRGFPLGRLHLLVALTPEPTAGCIDNPAYGRPEYTSKTVQLCLAPTNSTTKGHGSRHCVEPILLYSLSFTIN